MVLLYVYEQSPGYICVTVHGGTDFWILSEEPLTPEVSVCIGGQGRGQDYENDPVETRFPASGKRRAL
jgi:hypothetical protein